MVTKYNTYNTYTLHNIIIIKKERKIKTITTSRTRFKYLDRDTRVVDNTVCAVRFKKT